MKTIKQFIQKMAHADVAQLVEHCLGKDNSTKIKIE